MTRPYWYNGLRSEKQFKIGDKSRRKFFESYITDFIPLLDKLRQMVVHSTVFPIAAFTFDFTNLFGIILVVLTEHGKKGFMLHAQPQESIADFLAVT